ncbi:hypothetical protein B0H13DRAFT_2328006 [Mycena leptocephala]|nr:hypothetical protein B0H13DRAFT_2328006 [Mycena leptocephala]
MPSLATLVLVLLRVADTAVQTAIAADALRAVALLLEKCRVNAVMESIAEDVERLVAMMETLPRSSSMGPKGADDGLAEELRTAAEVLTRMLRTWTLHGRHDTLMWPLLCPEHAGQYRLHTQPCSLWQILIERAPQTGGWLSGFKEIVEKARRGVSIMTPRAAAPPPAGATFVGATLQRDDSRM